MKKLALFLVVAVVALYLVALFLPMDPQEQRPGLTLAGDVAANQDTDWSFLSGRNQIYVEMSTWYGIPHSVTTTSWVKDGQLYVPCGRCATKIWPQHVARDNAVTLKVNGELYTRRAVRVEDPHEMQNIMSMPEGQGHPEGMWVYRMEAR